MAGSRRLFIGILASVLTLGSGCVDPAQTASQVVVAPSVPDLVLRSISQEMVLEQGVTLGGGDFPQHASIDSGSGRLNLEVAPYAGCLVVELVQREGQGRVLLQAVPPSAADRTPLLVDGQTLYAEQDGSGNARLFIHDPQPGKWSFDIHADGMATGFRGTLYVTSLRVTVEGFTAVPD